MSWRNIHFKITIGGQRMDPTTADVLIEQHLGWNTIAHVRAQIPYYQADDPRLYEEDSLVEIEWGTKPEEVATWYGYVHYADVDTASPQRPGNVEIRYLLVGTGYLLTDQVRKVWRNITDSGIAREIAQKHGLSSVVHKTSYVHKYLYQDNLSDFDFLHERALKSGRKLHIENGVLYFIDVAAWAAAKMPYAPTYEHHKDPTRPTNILRFEAQVGGDLPEAFGRQLRRAIYGVDHASGKMITSRKQDTAKARALYLADDRPDSFADLEYRLSGHSTKTQEWVTAKTWLVGSSRLVPGQPIELKGRAIRNPLRGMWVINTASHYLRSYRVTGLGYPMFSTQVELARNTKTDYEFSDNAVPLIDDSCTPSNNGWKSSVMRHITL